MSNTRVQGAHAHAAPEKKRRKVARWVFLAFQVLFLVWVITGVHGGQSTDCTGLSAEDCASAKGLGTTLGVGMIIFFWMAFDVIWGITALFLRMLRRS